MSDRDFRSNAISGLSRAGNRDADSDLLSRLKTLPPRLSTSQLARRSARLVGRLFSSNYSVDSESIMDEPHALRTIECVTGGHGRCASSGCHCNCHSA